MTEYPPVCVDSPGAAVIWVLMAALGTITPAVDSAVSIFRLTLWQMRDPVSDQRTRILVLLNKGTPVKIRDTAARAEVL